MAEIVSRNRVGEIIQVVLHELEAAGGEARLGDLLRAAEAKLVLSDHEKAILEKSGFVRWHSLVQFYSIDFVKAAAIRKDAGKWFLTDFGREVIHKAPAEMMRQVGEKYREWRKSRDAGKAPATEVEDSVLHQIERQATYEKALEHARAEIEEHINELGPYDFQRLVAELLVAMGYHVPFVSSEGADGGIDIVAYKDPHGTQAPRIRVQVKHREQKVSVGEVRELEGVLKKEGDIGLIVSSGGFTADAIREIRSSHRHIETMDLDRLIRLWQENYESLREAGKKMIPLVRVYFLSPTEES